MITDLNNRKLISVKNQEERVTFSIHQLLQQRLLQDLDENEKEREEIFNLALELIRERLPRWSIDTPDSFKWTLFKEYMPHVLTILRIFDKQFPVIKPSVRLAEFFRDGGVHLRQRGIIFEGLRLLNSAEAILDRLAAEEYRLRVDIHIATVLSIQEFGITHRAESQDRFRRILIIRERLAEAAAPGTLTKEDDMELWKARADYGTALLQFNNYKAAEPIYRQCHEKYQEWGTEDDIAFEYGKLYHHLAFCRLYHKDFQSALRLSEKAIELISRQTKQPQLTLGYKFDLACMILQHGDIEKSLRMQQQILKLRLNLQGKGRTNYFTLQSYYAIGALYTFLGKLDEAEYAIIKLAFLNISANSIRHYMRKALTRAQERPKKGFWPEAAVARTEFHLAQVLKKSGKDGREAEELVQKAGSVLSGLLPWDPLEGVLDGDELVLYDHLQPVFSGRFTGTCYLKYVT
jgi:tetratricopeptide (TPR) repeat protein